MQANEFPRSESTNDSDPRAFMKRGACKELPPNYMYPEDGAGVKAARRVCAMCVVRNPCLEYALANKIEHGIWGGESERSRRRILKARRNQSATYGQFITYDCLLYGAVKAVC